MAGRLRSLVAPLLLEAMAYLSWGWVIPIPGGRLVAPPRIPGPARTASPRVGPTRPATGPMRDGAQPAGRATTKRLLA
jgi:hypothetical protein